MPIPESAAVSPLDASLDKSGIDTPLLSIAIPTFNRCNLLRETLETILPQIESFSDIVELVISDNGSTDSTWSLLQDYAVKHPFIRTFRQTTNIGPDPNFRFCCEQSRGEFFWLYGDDDLLCEGALGALIALLRKEAPDVVHIRHKWFVGQPTEPGSVTGKATAFHDERAFLRGMGALVSFITCMVVRKDVAQERVLEQLTGTFMIQYTWVLPSIRPGARMFFLEGVNILARGSNSYGYSCLDTFGKSMQRTLNLCVELGILTKRNRQLLLLIFLGDFLPYVLVADGSKLDRSFSRADFFEAYEEFPLLGRLSYAMARSGGNWPTRALLGIHRRILHVLLR